MLPRDGVVPGPERPISELTQVGLRHVHRLRVRRRVQAAIAFGLTVVLVAVTVPTLLRATSIGDVREIAPVDQPDRRPDEHDGRSGERPSDVSDVRRPTTDTDREAGAPSEHSERSSSRAASGAESITFATFRDDDDAAEIYTMGPDGGRVRRLTNTDWSESQPTWSPDGTEIAFTSGAYRPADGAHDIFIARADGSDRGAVRRLTRTDSHESDLAWSPNGRTIVFSRAAMGDYPDLFSLDIASGKTVQLTKTPEASESGAAWSPDGREIAFQRIDWASEDFAQGIYSIHSDGTALRRITDGSDFTPSWSPDGDRIAFSRRANLGGASPGGINTTPADSSSLYIVDADGSGLRRLTSDGTVIDYAPDWSPDGQRIVFTRDPDGSQDAYATFEFATGARGGPLSSIYVVDTDGSSPQELTDPTSGDSSAEWYGPPTD